jgi:hypothetical protein
VLDHIYFKTLDPRRIISTLEEHFGPIDTGRLSWPERVGHGEQTYLFKPVDGRLLTSRAVWGRQVPGDAQFVEPLDPYFERGLIMARAADFKMHYGSRGSRTHRLTMDRQDWWPVGVRWNPDRDGGPDRFSIVTRPAPAKFGDMLPYVPHIMRPKDMVKWLDHWTDGRVVDVSDQMRVNAL